MSNRSSACLALSVVTFVLLSLPSNAAVLLADDFNSYIDGPIAGQSGGTGNWTGAWNTPAFGGTADVSSGALVLDALFAISRPGSVPAAAVGDSRYMGFDLTLADANDSFGAALSGFGSNLLAETIGGQYDLNGTFPAGTTTTSTVRIILRGTNNGANDSGTLWVDPSAETDLPITQDPATNYAGVSANAGQLQLTFATGTIDNFIVATTFAEALNFGSSASPVPEPSTYLLFGAILMAGVYLRRCRPAA